MIHFGVPGTKYCSTRYKILVKAGEVSSKAVVTFVADPLPRLSGLLLYYSAGMHILYTPGVRVVADSDSWSHPLSRLQHEYRVDYWYTQL